MSDEYEEISARFKINPNNVPQAFHPLIPYAEKWSIGDYEELLTAIKQTPIEELNNLVKVVCEFDAEGFDEWLENPNADTSSKDWRSFILLIDACDVVKILMKQNRLPLKNDEEA